MHLSAIPFRVPLVAPLVLAGRTYRERVGVLLRLETGGHVGWGEASPLPGFSPDTLAEVETALATLTPAMLHSALAAQPHAPDLPLMPPAARAAVESALLDLHAQRLGQTMAEVLADAASATVELNGLITTHVVSEAATETRSFLQKGYRALKVKVGRRAVGEDVARVRAVAEAAGPNMALRLDANRAWSIDEVRAFAEGIRGIHVAYVEEPVASLEDLRAAARLLPIALDEMLVGATPELLHAHPYARTVILKPMLLGGIVSAWRWAQAARALRMDAVVSAAFESGVGMRANVALASALGGTSPAGLDTYRWIARDVLASRLHLEGPVVEVARVLAPLPPNLPDA